MKAIKSERIVMVDVDDTLVLWDTSKYPDEVQIPVDCYGYVTDLVPHHKNILLLKKFAKLGYTIIVWSQSGWEWAQEVAKALELDEYVTQYMSKPRYYFDDLPCEQWMGQRIYRDPMSGDE